MRVRYTGPGESRAYARNHAFSVGRGVSFRDSDPHPCGIELLLAALGADLFAGWQVELDRTSARVHAVELTLSGRLGNPLVSLGVVGESGDPGLAEITGTLYVSAEADERCLQDLWRRVLEHSAIHATLSRGAAIAITLKLTN